MGYHSLTNTRKNVQLDRWLEYAKIKSLEVFA